MNEEKFAMIRVNIGDVTGKQLFQIEKELTIGRDSSNDIVIPNSSVSRNHAKIYVNKKGEYIIEDLGSNNGTLLNGRLARNEILRNMDVILIADTELSFLFSDTPEEQKGIEKPSNEDIGPISMDSTAAIDITQVNAEEMEKLRKERPSITDHWKD